MLQHEGQTSELPDGGGRHRFATTHWSTVLEAGHSSAPGAEAALEKLCQTYWYPLYAYLRRGGHNAHDAQDLTQAFLARLLEKKILRRADPQRGKFRSFLLASLKGFLSDQQKKAQAQKRGGRQAPMPLDVILAEERYGLEPFTELTPEKMFDRHWALTVVASTVTRLREEYAAAGKAEHFEQLKHFQPGEESECSYAEVAAKLSLTQSAVKSSIHRMRTRHHELLREEIAHTVASPASLDEEIRYLISVIGG